MNVDVSKVLDKLGIVHQRSGSRYRAEKCPLPQHTTHNPASRWQNFSVAASGPQAGSFRCFSCKGGGSLVDLVIALLPIDTGDSRDDRSAALAWLRDVDLQAALQPSVRIRYVGTAPTFWMC